MHTTALTIIRQSVESRLGLTRIMCGPDVGIIFNLSYYKTLQDTIIVSHSNFIKCCGNGYSYEGGISLNTSTATDKYSLQPFSIFQHNQAIKRWRYNGEWHDQR